MKRLSQNRIALSGVDQSVKLLLPYDTNDTSDTNAQSFRAADPTRLVCEELAGAFDFFNETLFGGRLRPCIVTLQRDRRRAAYFASQRFETRDGTIVVDEIALNPDIFYRCSPRETFSGLVHEQVHALQEQFGSPSPNGYHNTQWADWMERIGLIPSDTGEPGGNRTGVRMSHYIDPEGLFSRACADWISSGADISFIDRWAALVGEQAQESPRNTRNTGQREAKRVSKTRFSCPSCGANAWGKPTLIIDCRPCGQQMIAS